MAKLTVARQNLGNATPAQQWAYFLRHAESLTLDEVHEFVPEPEFLEAAGASP